MSSVLANAVVNITASSVGLQHGFQRAREMVIMYTAGLQARSSAAADAMAAEVGNAANNVNQTFGRNAGVVHKAADEQAKAFGTNRAEFLAYAETLGREYTRLGLQEETAAKMASDLAAATGRYAASRRI